MKAKILAGLAGAGLAVVGWTGLEASLRPPQSWPRVYVRSGCGPSEQAITDARDTPPEVDLALLPLDVVAADLACAITLTRLARERPWLALVPEGWQCKVLRRHARAYYAALGLADEPAPIYQVEGRIGVGWSEGRRSGLIRGDLGAVLD